MNIKIPFVDLYAQYKSIKNEIDYVIDDVIKNSLFVRGPYVEKFEQLFSSLIGSKYCVSCANGTDSLYIAMVALGVRHGDQVIVPAHSWISTAETVTQAGAEVVFCDTDADLFTIDVKSIEEKITSRTVGIIPVHLYGQAVDMDSVMKIAKKHNLWVIEDCAQAHLAKYKGQNVGTFGDISSFSFYPGKNLGAMGDAGALLTNNELLAKKMAMFARHGGLQKGEHNIEGINSRMDGIQAAILTAKIPHLQKWIKLRQERAAQYSSKLSKISGINIPNIAKDCEHAWHIYAIKNRTRNGLMKFLNKNGVQTVINYPVALPFLPAYQRLKHEPQDFPNAHKNQSKILSLPIYPELTYMELDSIIELIREFTETGMCVEEEGT
jgi:dTDP-4-amino-4,6-dideoxygalactose transaminase